MFLILGLTAIRRIAEAKNLPAADRSGTSDPYAELDIPGKQLKINQTKTIQKTLNPEWDDEFGFEPGFINLQEDVLNIIVYDRDNIGKNDPLGCVSIPFKALLEKKLVNEWLPLNKYTNKVHSSIYYCGHNLITPVGARSGRDSRGPRIWGAPSSTSGAARCFGCRGP